MIEGIIGWILVSALYLLVANATLGPGGDRKKFEEGKQRASDFIEYVKGDEREGQ